MPGSRVRVPPFPISPNSLISLPDFPAFQNRGGNRIRRLGVDTGLIDEDRCTIASSDSSSVRLSGITVGITPGGQRRCSPTAISHLEIIGAASFCNRETSQELYVIPLNALARLKTSNANRPMLARSMGNLQVNGRIGGRPSAVVFN